MWGATTVFIRTTRAQARRAGENAALSARRIGHDPAAGVLADGRAGHHDLTRSVLAAFAYTVVVVAFVSYIAWFWLVRNYPPTRVSAFTFLSPVFGVLAGNLMLGEAFTPSLAAALALIAFGIYLVNRPQRG